MKATKKSELEQANEGRDDIQDQKSPVSGSEKTRVPVKPKPKPAAKDSEVSIIYKAVESTNNLSGQYYNGTITRCQRQCIEVCRLSWHLRDLHCKFQMYEDCRSQWERD